MTEEVSALFNFLTGYAQNDHWKKLVTAPQDLHDRTIELINEQAERARRGKRSWIFAKLNSLVDAQTIEALYDASSAGVPIDLVVRGICCLKPALAGVSENIRVRSIVDKYLEHSRIMVFGVGTRQSVYLSSADWMPRNFERRVEVMFPVEAAELKQRIVGEIVPTYLRDNQRARLLEPTGHYTRARSTSNETRYRSQLDLCHMAEGKAPLEADDPAASDEDAPKKPSRRGVSKNGSKKNGATGDRSKKRDRKQDAS